ncbi:MAG: phosphate/phosphite/phosphonate ABC transporter substrate-binding protein [Alphaproteobacteria bacterium]
MESKIATLQTAPPRNTVQACPMSIACFPWYELPETRSAQDDLWSIMAQYLRQQGMRDIPERLTRGPAIPGVFTDPQLLIGQCCGYDLIYGFASNVHPVATPRFDAAGCNGPNYRSFVLVRDDFDADDLDDLRGRACAVNAFNSQSGTNALRSLVAPLSENGRFFSEVRATGAHIRSLAALRTGKVDVMAMDCILYALLRRHRPENLQGTRVLCETGSVPAPPFITSATTDREHAALLTEALKATISDDTSREARNSMLLNGVEPLSLQDYDSIVDMEGQALSYGYREMHATSPAIV